MPRTTLLRGMSGCFCNVFQLFHAFEISSAAFLHLCDCCWQTRLGLETRTVREMTRTDFRPSLPLHSCHDGAGTPALLQEAEEVAFALALSMIRLHDFCSEAFSPVYYYRWRVWRTLPLR